MKIPFSVPTRTGFEEEFVNDVLLSNSLGSDGHYTKRCEEWLRQRFNCVRVLLTSSCTAALEISALLLNIKPGDEVIVPSFSFVSTANAFALRGANIIFVDIDPHTMNICLRSVEKALTSKTKAIVPIHYGGVPCEIEALSRLAILNGITLIEDAAQSLGSSFNGRALGSFGQLGALSFHATKNITSGGQGGALIVNDPTLVRRAETLRDKGTNRKEFLEGKAEKYTWVDLGSSYQMTELQAAYLWGQIQKFDEITERRVELWNLYKNNLNPLVSKGLINLPRTLHFKHNGHIFYVLLDSKKTRNGLLSFLEGEGIQSSFHFIPLHTSPAGQMYGRYVGADEATTSCSERLLRLPLWFGMSEKEVLEVCDRIKDFFGLKRQNSVVGAGEFPNMNQ